MKFTREASAEWSSFWFLPFVGALGYATSVLHIYSIGPFISPLQQAFGWSRAQISSGITIAAFVSGIFCIPIGMLVDRIGPRRVGLIGVTLMSLAFAALGTATGQIANWYLLWGAIAIGTLGVQTTVWTSAVASRYQASRGLAFAVTLSGASFAATIFPLLAGALISSQGWRVAFFAMAGSWILLVLPLLGAFFQGAQDGPAVRLDVPKATSGPGLTLSEGLRSPAMFKLLAAGGLFSFTVVGSVVHFVPILTDSGAKPMAAASVAALVGIFSIVGRLGTGVLVDRIAAHRVGAAAFVLPMIGSALLLFDGANPVSQVAAAVVVGLTLGSEVDVVAYLAARHFGLKSYGALYGALVMALAMGAAFGPLAAGAIFDEYRSYAPFLILNAVLMAASALVLLSLDPTPRWTGNSADIPLPESGPSTTSY